MSEDHRVTMLACVAALGISGSLATASMLTTWPSVGDGFCIAWVGNRGLLRNSHCPIRAWVSRQQHSRSDTWSRQNPPFCYTAPPVGQRAHSMADFVYEVGHRMSAVPTLRPGFALIPVRERGSGRLVPKVVHSASCDGNIAPGALSSGSDWGWGVLAAGVSDANSTGNPLPILTLTRLIARLPRHTFIDANPLPRSVAMR